LQQPPGERGRWDRDDEAGASWSWGPHEWNWTPTREPLGQRLNAAPKYARMSVTTDPVPPAERYEFWRGIVWPDWNGDPPTAAQRRDFRARAQGLFCGARTLVLFESDATSGGRARPPPSARGGAIHVGLVLSGQRLSQTDRDRPHLAQAGDLYAYDPDRDAKVAWPRRHRGVNVMIPRAALDEIFGAEIPPPTVLLDALSRSALAPMITAQFRLLARQAPHFNDVEAEAALGGTIDLIVAGLCSGGSQAASEAAASGDPTLLVAAQRYIDIHLSERDLDAARLAQALGCSRSTLYRAFAARELTIGGAIRDIRLGRFREALRRGSIVSIAVAAAQCGLTDARTARRLFKAAYGLSPRDFQAAAGSAGQVE
jgi:AraC family transcriptional activator of tynA and feaB